MAEYQRREVKTTRVEFVVEAPGRGSGEVNYWHDLRRAIHAIALELGPERSGYDDVVRVEARDWQIVLSYEKEQVV